MVRKWRIPVQTPTGCCLKVDRACQTNLEPIVLEDMTNPIREEIDNDLETLEVETVEIKAPILRRMEIGTTRK